MKYKILRNNPQCVIPMYKYRVQFDDDTWILRKPFGLIRGHLSIKSPDLINGWYLAQFVAEFSSCQEAKAEAEKILKKEEEIAKRAEKLRLENQWTECSC